ncbi:putative malate dehydrogenase 1B [Octopus vulgaris]|uniref:Malate dehydrogenase 1B n=1 Tax=Octopus vulgaris TaxID=6645 RepID=A0AA36BKB6_OCTVU|nr:putative malate dehydrogenase 1B [Octopus vulgaris]
MSKLLQGYSRTYQSCDTLYENETEFPPELINDLNSSGFPPYILVLKKHSSIMLLRNLDPAGGHCNGTRYMVVNLHNHLIEADVADGTHAGIRIMIPRIPLTTTEDYPFSFSRKQFPLKLAFERTNPKEWLCEICEANGWKHEQSPIIWRELVDRGGKGVLIGGSNEFEEYAYGYYGVTIDLDGKSMKIIAYENQTTKIELDEEERERIRNEKFIKVCITNASSPVCFSLVDSLLSGKIFGEEKISLCLLDCDPAQTAELQYIAENIQNMAYGLLYLNVFVTSDCEKAFKGSRIIIFLDEVERKEEEKVHRWTERNAVLFGFYGTTLLKVAKSDTLLLVAGNNYMCLNMSILNEIVSHISSRNIIGVSKVIENQAKSVLAEKLPASSCSIDNVVILGSISNDYLIELDKTLVREFDCAVVGPATFSQPLNDIFHQQSWLKKEYVNEVSSRKHVNEMNLRHPTYHLIGHAITTTLNYWWNGLSSNAIFSATLISDGKQNSSVFNLNSFRLQSALNSLEAKVPV